MIVGLLFVVLFFVIGDNMCGEEVWSWKRDLFLFLLFIMVVFLLVVGWIFGWWKLGKGMFEVDDIVMMMCGVGLVLYFFIFNVWGLILLIMVFYVVGVFGDVSD